MATEFKVSISSNKQGLTLTKNDIRALLASRGEGWADLAERLECSRENLSRLVNGQREYPLLRKKLERELKRMVIERRQHSKALGIVA